MIIKVHDRQIIVANKIDFTHDGLYAYSNNEDFRLTWLGQANDMMRYITEQLRKSNFIDLTDFARWHENSDKD